MIQEMLLKLKPILWMILVSFTIYPKYKEADSREMEFMKQITSTFEELNFKIEDKFENNIACFSSIIKWRHWN
jgi:hypothetical protein